MIIGMCSHIFSLKTLYVQTVLKKFHNICENIPQSFQPVVIKNYDSIDTVFYTLLVFLLLSILFFHTSGACRKYYNVILTLSLHQVYR